MGNHDKLLSVDRRRNNGLTFANQWVLHTVDWRNLKYLRVLHKQKASMYKLRYFPLLTRSILTYQERPHFSSNLLKVPSISRRLIGFLYFWLCKKGKPISGKNWSPGRDQLRLPIHMLVGHMCWKDEEKASQSNDCTFSPSYEKNWMQKQHLKISLEQKNHALRDTSERWNTASTWAQFNRRPPFGRCKYLQIGGGIEEQWVASLTRKSVEVLN